MSRPPIPEPRSCLVTGAIARSIDEAYAGYLARLERRPSVPDGTDEVGPLGQELRTDD